MKKINGEVLTKEEEYTCVNSKYSRGVLRIIRKSHMIKKEESNPKAWEKLNDLHLSQYV